MNVSLTPQLEMFVHGTTESADYNDYHNINEVVREAIGLCKRAKEQRASKLSQLRIALAEAEEAVNGNQSYLFNSADELDRFFEQC